MNARQICHALSGLPHKRGTLKLFTFQHLFKQINQTPMLNLHSILLLPSFISLLSTSFVDGKGLRPRRRMKLAKRALYEEDVFECSVFQTVPISLGDHELPVEINCETDVDDNMGDKVFRLTGDTDTFFEGIDISHGDVTIRVPFKFVQRNEINFSTESSSEIIITYTGNDRKRRNLAETIGTLHVLVVRVSRDGSSSKKVAQSAAQLSTDFFGDNQNLKTIYDDCSGGKLNIVEATGNNIVDGVIDLQAPSNICNMDYSEVGDWALEEIDYLFREGSTAKIDYKMIVMPNDNCVDFRGAAAWAQVSKTITWYQSQYASYPVTQVHELAHNLGAKHSGAPNESGIFKQYLDGNGYMSNKPRWNDEGSKMCFNAPKLWYFDWWSSYNELIVPTGDITSKTLIPLADVQRLDNTNDSLSSYRMILKMKSTFIIFNRAKGINSGVRRDENKVVITDQSGNTQVSQWIAALGEGETYRYKNWSDDGNALVIKVTNIDIGSSENYLDKASIQIYVENGPKRPVPLTSSPTKSPTFKPTNSPSYSPSFSPSRSPTLSPSNSPVQNDIIEYEYDEYIANRNSNHDTCTDFIPRGHAKWYDSDGPVYDCEWYGSDERYCAQYGNHYSNWGYTANEACCVCKR